MTRRSLSWCLLALALALGVSHARADEARFELDIDAQCACADETRRAFDALFGRSFERVLAERGASLSVRIHPTDDGRWTGATRLLLDGRTADRRIDAGSCREISEAVTLLAAIAIEPTLEIVPARDPESVEPERRPSTDATDATNTTGTASTPGSAASRAGAPPIEESPVRLAPYVTTSAEFATLPSVAVLFAGGLTLRLPKHVAVAVDVGSGFASETSATVVSGEVLDVAPLIAVAARVCYRVALAPSIELAACGGYRHLASRARSEGFERGFVATLHTPSILAGASVTWSVLPWLGLRLGIDSLFHTTTHSFVARDVFFGDTVRLAGTASAGLAPSFSIEFQP